MNFISSIFKQPSSSTSTDDQSPDSDNGDAVKVTIKTDKVFKDDSSLHFRSSRHGSLETNLTSIHEHAGSIPGPNQWVKDLALP